MDFRAEISTFFVVFLCTVHFAQSRRDFPGSDTEVARHHHRDRRCESDDCGWVKRCKETIVGRVCWNIYCECADVKGNVSTPSRGASLGGAAAELTPGPGRGEGDCGRVASCEDGDRARQSVHDSGDRHLWEQRCAPLEGGRRACWLEASAAGGLSSSGAALVTAAAPVDAAGMAAAGSLDVCGDGECGRVKRCGPEGELGLRLCAAAACTRGCGGGEAPPGPPPGAGPARGWLERCAAREGGREVCWAALDAGSAPGDGAMLVSAEPAHPERPPAEAARGAAEMCDTFPSGWAACLQQAGASPAHAAE